MSNLVSLAALQRETGFSRDRIRGLLADGMPCEREGRAAAPGQRAKPYLFDLDRVQEWLDARDEAEAFAPVMAEDDPRRRWAVARAENLKAKLDSDKRDLVPYEFARSMWSESVTTFYRALMSKADAVAAKVASDFPETKNHDLKKMLRAEIKNAFVEIKKRENVLPEPPIPMDGIKFETPPENAEVASRLHPSDPRRLVAELQAERLRIKTAIETRNLITLDEFIFALKDQLMNVRQAIWHCPARIMHPIFVALDDERKWIFRDAFREEIRGLLGHGVDAVHWLFEEWRDEKEAESESETF